MSRIYLKKKHINTSCQPNAAAIQPAMEPEVLPVFYYNDMLLSAIGDTIGSLEICLFLFSDMMFSR